MMRGLGPGHERHQRGDFVGTPVAVERGGGLRHRPSPAADSSRCRSARLDVVDRDAPASDLLTVPKHLHGSLRSRVGHQPRRRDARQCRAGHDDAAAILNVFRRSLRRGQCAAHVVTRSSPRAWSFQGISELLCRFFHKRIKSPKVATVFSPRLIPRCRQHPPDGDRLSAVELDCHYGGRLVGVLLRVPSLHPRQTLRDSCANAREPPVTSATLSANFDMYAPLVVNDPRPLIRANGGRATEL